MEIITELLNTFEERYQPALKVVESDEQLSSQEILGSFNTVAEISLDELYEGLRERGFVSKMVGNQILWIVKEKSPN